MADYFNLQNKRAIVTGGYGHLGSEMVRAMAQAGAEVFVAGRDEEKFNDKFGSSENVNFVMMDVSDEDSIKKALELVSAGGGLDILINNAYFGAANHPEEMSLEEWKVGIEGGLNSVFACLINAIPFMKEKGGKIINISSMYGVTVPDLSIYDGREHMLNPPNYGTAKAGMIHLTKYYAMYLAKYKINVNAISPGPFPSETVQEDEEFVKRLADKTLLKRIGEPNDLSGTILFLSSSASDYITGQNLVVDGGWTV